MPTIRIPIDGLWRCLCPSFDAPLLSNSRSTINCSRVATRPGAGSKSLSSSFLIRHRTRSFHTSKRRQSQSKQLSTDDEPQISQISQSSLSSMRSEKFQAPATQQYTPLSPETKSDLDILQEEKGRIELRLDELTIPQIHDGIRHLRTQAGKYWKVARLVSYLIRVRGEKPALFHYDSLIKVNADAGFGSAKIVKNLLAEMKELGIAGDSQLFHGVLHVLAIHPDYVLRAEVIQEMKLRWFGLSPEGWHSLVVGLIRDHQYEVAMDKLEEMHKDGIYVQPWLYDIFIFQLGEVEELDECLRLLLYRYHHSGDEILANVWYYLLEKFSCGFHYEGTKFIWELRVQTTEHINPPDGMCIGVLDLAARYSDPDLATSVIRILSERHSVLSLFHYEALLAAYTGARDLPTAFRVLSIMTKAGLSPNAATTRPLFLYLASSPDLPAKAWTALKEVAEKGHPISVAAVNVIIESYVQTGLVDEAMEVYKELHKICVTGPNTETFNTLLQGVSRQKTKAQAMFLASEMAALGIGGDRLTYDRLILACLQDDDYEDAVRYLDEMIAVGADKEEDGQRGWWMRAGTAALMVKRCVQAGDELAWDILREMEARGMEAARFYALAKQNWPGKVKEREKPPKEKPSGEDKLKSWAVF